MQHTWNANVVYIPAITECESFCFVLHSSTTDATRLHHDRNFASSDHFNSVKNLHIACATTKVRAEMFCHVSARKVRTLLIHLSFGAHNNARNTKTTLQSATCRKCLRICIALLLRYALQCDDGRASYFCERCLATYDGLAIDQHRAATALTGGRATIFGRCDVQLFT